jgi:hypothetical protein
MKSMGAPASALRVIGHAALYFALVFGAGFALGPIRVLWLAPLVGERAAELIEAPLMLAVIVLASQWIARHRCAGWSGGALLAVGVLAAAVVLAADLAVGLSLRGMSVAQVFLERDPVSGSVYYALVTAMALAPWLWGRGARSGAAG